MKKSSIKKDGLMGMFNKGKNLTANLNNAKFDKIKEPKNAIKKGEVVKENTKPDTINSEDKQNWVKFSSQVKKDTLISLRIFSIKKEVQIREIIENALKNYLKNE